MPVTAEYYRHSRWRHNWKSAQVVNSHLVSQPGNRVSTFLGNSGLCWTISHGTGTLRCLQKEMATYRHRSVSLWRDPDDVSHCWILSPDKTEWRLISATLCGWRRCFVAELWFMTRKREDYRHVWLLFLMHEWLTGTPRTQQVWKCLFPIWESHKIQIYRMNEKCTFTRPMLNR